MRLLISCAIARGVSGVCGDSGVVTANDESYAASNRPSASIRRNEVGNQIGPRQLEFPPNIAVVDSAGA